MVLATWWLLGNIYCLDLLGLGILSWPDTHTWQVAPLHFLLVKIGSDSPKSGSHIFCEAQLAAVVNCFKANDLFACRCGGLFCVIPDHFPSSNPEAWGNSRFSSQCFA
jgi:hypothetical protein